MSDGTFANHAQTYGSQDISAGEKTRAAISSSEEGILFTTHGAKRVDFGMGRRNSMPNEHIAVTPDGSSALLVRIEGSGLRLLLATSPTEMDPGLVEGPFIPQAGKPWVAIGPYGRIGALFSTEGLAIYELPEFNEVSLIEIGANEMVFR